MKERGLLLSAPMVRAERAGLKTQTRRVMDPQPQWRATHGLTGKWIIGSPVALGLVDRGDYWMSIFDEDCRRRCCTREAYGWGARAGCPHGTVGDRLWVREAWRSGMLTDQFSPAQMSPHVVWYEADGPAPGACNGRYRHGRFMPRWASRTLLEIVDVRVQRLQDISEADAMAEGALPAKFDIPMDHAGHEYRDGYRILWECINGAGSWGLNPWVWAITFKRV